MPLRPKHSIPSTQLRLKLAGTLLVLLYLVGPALSAQEQRISDSRLAFFEKRAQQDALYEHTANWQSEEDALDFWTDQRNFEKELEKSYYQGYQLYIVSKKAAYLQLQKDCYNHDTHGEYYQLQEAYYNQMGGPSLQREVFIATSASH